MAGGKQLGQCANRLTRSELGEDWAELEGFEEEILSQTTSYDISRAVTACRVTNS